jgi:hypothetical protein
MMNGMPPGIPVVSAGAVRYVVLAGDVLVWDMRAKCNAIATFVVLRASRR